jgi:hypothetical protein
MEPGSLQQNSWVDSFNGKARDELFDREVFDTILEARVLHDDWREIYNHRRPHSSLGYQAPAVFAAASRRWDTLIEGRPKKRGPVYCYSLHVGHPSPGLRRSPSIRRA